MAGARIGADEALAWGLVDRIVPEPSCSIRPHAGGRRAGAAPAHVAAIKRMLR